jgi:hypothetical protein
MVELPNEYQENFIKGVRTFMIDMKLDSIKEASDTLGMSYQTLYKIMDRTNKPTVDHGVNLCGKGGFDANWLFLNRGEMYQTKQATLNGIMREVQRIKGIPATPKRKRST